MTPQAGDSPLVGGPSLHGEPPVSHDQLVDLLHEQHVELVRTLDRVPKLSGCAREDVFLRARRLLAVHETLERLLVDRDAALDPGLGDDVAEVEALPHDSAEFETAYARVVRDHLARTQDHEQRLAERVGRLGEDDRTRVATAVRMWHGDGDAYLGNTFAEMLATAAEQLASPTPEVVPEER